MGNKILPGFEHGRYEPSKRYHQNELITNLYGETVKRDNRINIRISSKDLSDLQRMAREEGVPYQSLVASILHRYINGGLQDSSEK